MNALPMAHSDQLMAGTVLAMSHVPWAIRRANLTHTLQLPETRSHGATAKLLTELSTTDTYSRNSGELRSQGKDKGMRAPISRSAFWRSPPAQIATQGSGNDFAMALSNRCARVD